MSSSMRECLQKQDGWDFAKVKERNTQGAIWDRSVNVDDFNKPLPDDWQDCWKFAIFREPIDRFISAYLTRCLYSPGYQQEDYTSTRVIREILIKKDFDIHLEPQTKFLPVRMDYYAIFERIEKDWKVIQRKTGLPFPNRIQVMDTKLKEKIGRSLTPDLIQLVKDLYKEDLHKYEQILQTGSI